MRERPPGQPRRFDPYPLVLMWGRGRSTPAEPAGSPGVSPTRLDHPPGGAFAIAFRPLLGPALRRTFTAGTQPLASSFFDLGGDSIHAIEFGLLLEEVLGVEIDPVLLMGAADFAAVANALA